MLELSHFKIYEFIRKSFQILGQVAFHHNRIPLLGLSALSQSSRRLCESRRRVRASYASRKFAASISVFSSLAVMAGGSLRGGWGVPLHPTASLFTASRFQPLKKALYPNKEAKSTLYSNKEPFYARSARDRGESP